MIKFLRKTLKNYFLEGKLRKSLKYFTSEVLLIFIGVFAGLQMDRCYYEKDLNSERDLYIKSLHKDLLADQKNLNDSIISNKTSLKYLKSVRECIYGENVSPETLEHIARFEFNTGLRTVNEYHTKVFNALVATGKIDLVDVALVERLMELKRLQETEKKINNINRDIYYNRLNEYSKFFGYPGNRFDVYGPIKSFIWKDIDYKVFVPRFTNLVNGKFWGTKRYISITQRVKDSTDSIIKDLEYKYPEVLNE